MQSELLQAALGYLDDCRTVIPLNGKVPVIPSWKEYQEGKAPTPEEMTGWFNTYGDRITGLGMVTGYVHGLAVLDLENDEDPTRFELPPTAVSRTGSGGWHYFFDFPKDTDFVKSGSLIPSGIHGDMKADGGYVVVPPSIHPTTGKAYEWITPLELETELAPMPEWLAKIEDDRKKNDLEATDWKAVLDGATKGTRHDTAVKLAGKLLHHLPGKDWKDVALPLLHAWNDSANEPPLPDNEVMSIFRGIAQKQHAQGDEGTVYFDKEVGDTPSSPRVLLAMSAIMNLPESERPEFLVHGLVPEHGITALSGHPGSGKSWFMLHLAKSVATGESFLGYFRTKQGKVLIVDEEQGAWEQRRRLELLGYSAELPIYFYCLNGFKLDNEKDIDLLLKTIREQEIGLVMIDPFAAIHSQDENSAEGAQKVLEGMQKLVAAGTTVLFIHHHRKSAVGAPGGAQSLRGSSAYSGRLDSHITVEKKDNTHAVQNIEIEHVKSRRGPSQPKFKMVLTQDLDVEKGLIELRYASIEEYVVKKAEAKPLITTFLAQDDSTKEEIIKAVQDEAEIGTRNIVQALSDMVKEGALTITKEGKKNKYHLEPASLTEDDTEPPY
jgi:ABC-type multidrug transport system ATPase subunit